MKRPWHRLLRRGGALVFAALAVPAPAVAGVRLGTVDATGYPEVRTTLVAPHAVAAPHLWEDGRPAPAQAAANLGRFKSVVLALDRSHSMHGRSLADATHAAQTFVHRKAAADRIAVLAFGHRAIPLTRFSASTIDVDSALRDVTADTVTGTALYDAVVTSARRVQHEVRPGHVIIVLTDGHDVSSTATLDDAIEAAHRARAAVYPIAIASKDFTPGPLRRLAAATGGTYHQTSSSKALASVYAAIGRELSRTWQVTYVTAARPGEHVKLTVTVPGAGQAARTVAFTSAAGVGADSVVKPIIPASAYSTTGTLAIGGTVAFLVLLACAFMLSARKGKWVRSRLEPHLGTVKKATKARRRDQRRELRARFVATVERTFGNLRQFKRLQRQIERADLPLRAAELLAIAAGIGFGLAVVLLIAGAGFFMAFLAFLFGLAAPIAYVTFKAGSRLKAFENQLPDLLITMAASLKAGHSFRSSVQSVVDEGQPPAAKEFRRVLTETQLGRPMDDALGDMAERVGSDDLSFVITSVTIQRQVGGSLAGLFDMVAETVRQRQQFARKVRSLTAMGRMSAYTLMALPFLVALIVMVLSPSYLSPLFHTKSGHEMVFAALLMMGIGSVVLKKIVSFRG